MLPKVDRLRIILDRLASAPRAATHAEAFDQLADVIDAVEDELTHIPRDPNAWQSDGRIYPPQLDARRDVDGRPDLARYRSVGHNTYLRDNGAIEIRALDGTVVFAKPGDDGRHVGL